MKELELLRYDIDRIDSRLIELYNERMSVVSEVAEYKYQKGEAIFQPDREELVLDQVALLAGETNGKKVRLLYKTLMRQSRERQYEILSADSNVSEIIGCEIETEILAFKAAYAGLPGSYTHIAAQQLYPTADLHNFVLFDNVLEAVASGTCDIGILPIDNTTEGIVADVYEGLMKYNLYISGSITMPIRHCLLGIKDSSINGIKRVISHPQALGQCSEYIKNHYFDTESEINTAVAAERISRECKIQNAAVASSLSATLYGLDILDQNINDAECNKTRFITVTKKPIIRADADRISLSFVLPHQSGALVQILSIAADYQLNLLNVQSIPLPQKPWEHRFYMDIAGNVSDKDIRSILLMLYTELEEIRFLGNYKDEGGQNI